MKALVHETVYKEACRRGREAGEQCDVRPMTVEEHVSPLDDNSPVAKRWHCPQGICGFAWIIISPGTSSFARWLKSEGHAHKCDRGGVSIWVYDYNQSYERKIAHAAAFAAYLRSVGINARSEGRLD